MGAKNRVKIKVLGNEFTVISDDSEEYILDTAEKVESRITGILNERESMSVSLASVFAAMEFCDESEKAKQSADNLRVQIKDYFEEAARARSEAESARKKAAELSAQVQSLQARLSRREGGM